MAAEKNTGNITLNISSITASGDFLQKNNWGTSVPAGASCTINVAFRPNAKGIRTGNVDEEALSRMDDEGGSNDPAVNPPHA